MPAEWQNPESPTLSDGCLAPFSKSPEGERALKRWLGLGLTLGVALAIIVLAGRANREFYRHNLHEVWSDSIHYAAKLGETLRFNHQQGWQIAVGQALSYRGGASLQFVLAAAFGSWLPMDMVSAVVLNAIWYFVLAVSAHELFRRKTGNSWLACLLVIPLLASPHLLAQPTNGLTDIDLNILGYTIGGAALCWALLSDHFRKWHLAALSGLLLGLLMMGRVFMLGLILPSLLPLLAAGLWNATRAERRRTLGGAAIALAVMVLVGLWAILPSFLWIAEYPTRYWGQGLIGRLSLARSVIMWGGYVGDLLCFGNIPLLAMIFGWRWGHSWVRCNSLNAWLKQLNWVYLGMAVIPLLILIGLRASYLSYGMPCFLSLYLLAMFPLRADAEAADVQFALPAFRWALLAAVVISLGGSLEQMRSRHRTTETSRENALALVNAILRDAKQASPETIRVKLASQDSSGIVLSATVDNLLLYSTPYAVYAYRRQAVSPATSAAGAAPRVEIIPALPKEIWLNLLTATGEELARQVDEAYGQFTQTADYFIVLGPTAQRNSPDRGYALLSERMLRDTAFKPLTAHLAITPAEDAIVLCRTQRPTSPPQ